MASKAIVTGGSRGIGRAIVHKLADDGIDIVFNYHSGKEAARKVVTELKEKGVKASAFKMDATNFDEAADFVSRAKDFLGEVDLLVNNAGITRDKSLFIMEREDWNAVINTNLTGYFNVTRQIIGYFLKNQKGCVINISSVSGLTGLPGQTNYCASKAGIIGFTRALAKEGARLGVPVNCVAPGFIETDMTSQISEKHIKQIKKQIPMRRLGKPEEVAELVSFLASDRAKYITGQVFPIDGGLSS